MMWDLGEKAALTAWLVLRPLHWNSMETAALNTLLVQTGLNCKVMRPLICSAAVSVKVESEDFIVMEGFEDDLEMCLLSIL